MQFVVNAVSERERPTGSQAIVSHVESEIHTKQVWTGERQVQVMIVLHVTLTHLTQKRMKARAFQSQARLFTCRILPYVVVKQTEQ